MDKEVQYTIDEPTAGKSLQESMKRVQISFGGCANWWSGMSPLQFGDIACFPGDEESHHASLGD